MIKLWRIVEDWLPVIILVSVILIGLLIYFGKQYGWFDSIILWFAPVTAWFNDTFGPVFAWFNSIIGPVFAWFSSIFAPVSAWFSNLFGSDNNEVQTLENEIISGN